MGGQITFPFLSLYHSTKWAVEGFTESLSYELSSLGIQVKLIEPGVVLTDFYGRSMTFSAKEGLTAYDELLAKYQASTSAERSGSTPEQLAEAIYGAATDGKNQLRYLVGPDAEQLVGLRKAQGDDAYVAAITQQMLS
jgi:short-subunit dehydrogenase